MQIDIPVVQMKHSDSNLFERSLSCLIKRSTHNYIGNNKFGSTCGRLL